ncbi:MAG: 16S rRNA (guanine(966)-N(2))-methyltransferase RsmD [Bacilli bacterium]|nr:16S rRNA (guanine(966)-N(2))-methyltransferase RsmD [Bacilli bacterium]
MRVISGFLRGREIKGYTIDGTRPTMDRVKESMFAIIQDYISGSVCLDLFAGTGNLGIEAISNGAKKVYFNDKNKIACKIIKQTIDKFEISDKCEILNKDYLDALDYYKENHIKFNIVFLDPPYDNKVITEIFKTLYRKRLLKKDAIVVCEYTDQTIEEEYFDVIKSKNYGYKKVGIYVQKK